ncbi:MAG TPA: hypothetical protein VFH70_05560 [Acidimicrobiales bacterium]|nr:hypothetical protein [Acidimicrobiales bacterium]
MGGGVGVVGPLVVFVGPGLSVVVEFGTPEWAEAAGQLWSLLPPADSVNGTVSLAIAVAPRKEVTFHWCYEAGQVVSGAAGGAADSKGPVLALTLSAADAADFLGGELATSVSFMRGRLKASGDGALLLAFLGSTESEEFAQWRSRLGALAAA